jgi:Asp-tRNA(Asn)/Glu-tRNA(Gln) amidotransferase A subunit family amidase
MQNHKKLNQSVHFSAARALFKTGQDTPRALLERCLQTIEANESDVHAFVKLNVESARIAADASTKRYAAGKPLSAIDGMPFGVKDIIDTGDMPTQMGNSLFKDHQPKIDAACVRALKLGGAVILGKTVTTEFAIGRSGPTKNPWNTDHTPGGSSSGSAAGVGAGFMSAAFGTQTQGSIIRPSSFCGVVGYKPSIGALPIEGIHPLSTTHDHLGVLAEGVKEAWAVARWVSEAHCSQDHRGLEGEMEIDEQPLPLRRVAFLKTKGFYELDQASQKAFEQSLERLRQAGVTIVTPDESAILKELCELLDQVPEYSLDLVSVDMRWPYLGYMEVAKEHMGPRFTDLMDRAAKLTREDYQHRLSFRDGLRARIKDLENRFDALILPAASGTAPEGFINTGSRTLLTYSSFIGNPSIAIPAMLINQMPLGLQLMGFYGVDYRLARHSAWALDLFKDPVTV